MLITIKYQTEIITVTLLNNTVWRNYGKVITLMITLMLKDLQLILNKVIRNTR